MKIYLHKSVCIITVPAGTWRKYNVVSTSMQRHDVNITSSQRRCNVMTLHRRWGDVIFTSCARWGLSSPSEIAYQCITLWQVSINLYWLTVNKRYNNKDIVFGLYIFNCLYVGTVFITHILLPHGTGWDMGFREKKKNQKQNLTSRLHEQFSQINCVSYF